MNWKPFCGWLGIALLLPHTAAAGFDHYTGLAAGARLLAEDFAGTIWIAGGGPVTGENLSAFNGIDFSSFQIIGSGPGFAVIALAVDRSGKLWMGTDGFDLLTYDGDQIERFAQIGGEYVDLCSAILVDAAGDLWLALSRGGVLRQDGKDWTVYRPNEGFGNDAVLSMHQDRSGQYWFGTRSQGVSRFDGTMWTRFTARDGLPQGAIVEVAQDGAGGIWAASAEHGVATFDGMQWSSFTVVDGLASDSVTAIAIDPEGNPWFGTARGLSRFDSRTWLSLRAADGLRDEQITDLLTDQSGNLWIATQSGLLSRFDRTIFETVKPEGIPDGTRATLTLRDRAGCFWFLRPGGLTRFDGETWTHFDASDGLPGTPIAIAQGPADDYWLLGSQWLSRYDGSTFSNVAIPDSLGILQLNDVAVDHDGVVWVATEFAGAITYDGTDWGVAFDGGGVTSLFVATNGWVWFGTKGGSIVSYDGAQYQTYHLPHSQWATWIRPGVFFEAPNHDLWVPVLTTEDAFRFDGVQWHKYSALDHGLTRVASVGGGSDPAEVWVSSEEQVQRYNGRRWSELLDNNNASLGATGIFGADDGSIWLQSWTGLIRHEPDRVSPQTRLTRTPPLLSANRIETIEFTGVFETPSSSIGYSVSFNGEDWSPWSPQTSWLHSALPDGHNVFRVRSRDFGGNVDRTPASIIFEIDGTPPTPILSSPPFGGVVSGTVDIRGTADDPRFVFYELEVKASDAPWETPYTRTLAQNSVAVQEGELGRWDTMDMSDGTYDLRLAVHDSLGLTGRTVITVVVDNLPPPAVQTSPARVSARLGGDVYTTNKEIHLYFPPNAFSNDVVVSVSEASGVPDSLRDGSRPLSPIYSITWQQAGLRKPATLEFSLDVLEDPEDSRTVAIHAYVDGGWTRIGGSVVSERNVIAARIDSERPYALFRPIDTQPTGPTLGNMALFPRVFSPSGKYATNSLVISFELGRATNATVQVFSRSGRLIRRLAVGRPMQAGSNLIYWDGRDEDGRVVHDDIYLVSVEAADAKQVRTVAVVR